MRHTHWFVVEFGMGDVVEGLVDGDELSEVPVPVPPDVVVGEGLGDELDSPGLDEDSLLEVEDDGDGWVDVG